MSFHKSGQYCTVAAGDNISGYIAEKKLGKGHYSTVWMADKNGKKYAVKVFRSSTYYREVFDNELKIMKLVSALAKQDKNSKYVITHVETVAFLKYYYGGSGDDLLGTSVHPCFVMPMYGESLADLLESDDYYQDEFVVALKIPAAKNIMIQLLKGLSFLHKNNIIHTDINTANILMTKPMAQIKHSNEIQVVISDLGTAFPADKPSDDGNGTKEYLSPEQRLNIPLTVQTDIWSLGCVFYELVTNSLLFDFSDNSNDTSNDTSSGSEDDHMKIDNNDDNDDVESDDESETDALAEWNESYEHFVMMEGLLGPAPKEITKHGRQFFNKHGKLNNNPEIPRTNIVEILLREFEYTQEEVVGITEFLYCMVQYKPNDRSTAANLLNNKFLAPNRKPRNKKKKY